MSLVPLIRHEYTNKVISRTSDDVAQTHTDFTTEPPTVTPYTAPETKAALRNVEAHRLADNKSTLLEQARTALGNNKDFLLLSTPTNAQSLKQIQSLTRQINGIIRVVANELTEVD